jgi:hypothetical protein
MTMAQDPTQMHQPLAESRASQPAPIAQEWLVLTDYASKYRVSISTLRRRIKNSQIRFRFDNGKYFLLDEAPLDSASEVAEQRAQAHVDRIAAENDGPILSTAARLLTELKSAYTSVLQEKEEQIIQLKEEVSDLKTLVRVLESDNDRLRGVHRTSAQRRLDTE